ncbi:MAG: histidine phosphatase family protein [Candidatus Berkelbacteria bacterium]|nr:histidine phosphatase family protein [Candidatus Berkelbacteria bacterium]
MPEKFQTTIFLVRHGETDRPWKDNIPIDSQRRLTERGKKQIVLVAKYLAEFQPSALFTSPLHRCVESAEIINKQLSQQLNIQQQKELFEYYTPERDSAVTNRVANFIEEAVREWAGHQIVAVTHQDPIQFALAHYFKKNPINFPCEMSDVYRLVFAGKILTEATRLQPAYGL